MKKHYWKLLLLPALFVAFRVTRYIRQKRQRTPQRVQKEIMKSLPLSGAMLSVKIKPQSWDGGEPFKNSELIDCETDWMAGLLKNVQVQPRPSGSISSQPPKIAVYIYEMGDITDPIGQVQIDWFSPRSVIQSVSVMQDGRDGEFNSNLAVYELTPQSRHAILDSIEKKFGLKLRALKIPPP